MKKPLLSACIGLALFAGCTDNVSDNQAKAISPPSAHEPLVEDTLPARAPVIPDVLTLEVAPEPVVAHPFALTHEGPCRVQHLARMSELRELGELKDALREARLAVHDAPEDIDAISHVAQLANRVKEYSMAAVAYGELARLMPDDAMPYVHQARMLLALKDTESALESVGAALLRDSALPEAFHVRGRALLEESRLAEAIEAFEQAVELQPDHGYALNNLGFTYLRTNENEKALEVLEVAAELLPEVAYVQNNLGVALERNGFVEEAQSAFELATALSPKYLKARLNSTRLSKVASAASALPSKTLPESGELSGAPSQMPSEVLEMAPSDE